VADILTFKAHLHVTIMPGEGVLVISEDASKALHGRAYEKVAPLIDGGRTADDIVDALAGEVDAARVYFVLADLEAKGYLAALTPGTPAGEAAFWHSAGLDPATARDGLDHKRVKVLAVGQARTTPLLAALPTAGVQTTENDAADLWIVVADDYLRPELAAINDAALAAGRPWMLVRANGREQWLGPVFRPGETGCWQCLERPLARNRMIQAFAATKIGAKAPLAAREALPAAFAAACQMAAVAAAQILAGARSGLEGRVLSLDWASFAPGSHVLTRDPACPACGVAPSRAAEPMTLRPSHATFTADGGHRSMAPEKTLKAYQHLVSPITGVVHKLQSMTPDDDIAHVFVAGHNAAGRLTKLADLKRSLRSASAGKGVFENQARVSALCEAIERYSGELSGAEIKVRRAWRDWSAGEAIHPNIVMGFSAAQYEGREAQNAKESRFNHTPEPLPDDLPIDWTPVWSLTKQRQTYLPTQLVYFNAPAAGENPTLYAAGCSNGNASGNTPEEAILQGFFELVERDAVALWWYNRLPRPAVATETFGEPYLRTLTRHYLERYGRECWALDLTTDLGIPVFVALSRVVDAPQEKILFGLGCHLDAKIALQRAFAEMNQLLILAQAGDAGTLDDPETEQWLKTATLANQPYLVADPSKAPVRFEDFPVRHTGDFVRDIDHCRGVVEGLGMEMLVLDQTRPNTGMPVVKVIVPGLRHFWARFGPGRLYDAPVKLGWLETPLTEAQLNPIALFI
jgi:ribosomal protein S12 methylthiotransferase accessory factor